ncbi:hypothetical protein IKG49_01475 [Candidatus Saccharibacteria bacterium]|nr:hypothetical protein [Candidatus Saccharibacteria bacterium]
MDQNQVTVDDDLQKAIDDITTKTNIDPVFSDPVAAPSSVPEGDTGELGEPVGPFPEPKVEAVAPAPEPIAPLESVNIPELDIPMPAEAPTDMPMPPVAESVTEVAVEAPASAPISIQPSFESAPSSLSTGEVKKAALRDLLPLLDRLNMDSTEKFNLYRDVFEDLKDYTILDPAYHAAREIPDETARANALLYLVKAIDRM